MDIRSFIVAEMAHPPSHLHADPTPAIDPLLLECELHRIDPLVALAVCYIESGYNPRAVSGVGARGLMQIMPATAHWLAEQLGIPYSGPESLFEPELNVRLGVGYLASLYAEFTRSWPLALTAYNRGPTATHRLLAANGGALPERVLQSYANLVLARYYDFVRRMGPTVAV